MATINYRDPSTKQWIEIPTGITVDTSLSSTSENPVQNKVINSALNEKYTKPTGGIPKTELASDVQTSLAKANSALQSVKLEPGTNNGTLKLTVNGTATDNIAVKNLGSAAFTAASNYATAAELGNYYTKTESDAKYSQATNLENGTGTGSLKQRSYSEDGKNSIATGIGSVAFGGLRFDYDPEKHSGDKTNTAAGNQSFVAGCGNYTAGDWSFVTGKDNTVYSNRAFVSGGANVSQAINSEGNLLEEKTNVGRFNAIFGNNNTFKSSDTSKESNLIAGGSNTVDTERSIVVGYNNNVTGNFDAIFGFKNVVNATYSLTGGGGNTINGAYHLVAGSGNKVSGQYNIASGQDNENLGWNSAVIGRELIVGETHTSQTVLGQYNDNKPDTVLEIGWGDVNNRKNIFEVYRDGTVKTGKGTLSTEEYARNYTDNAVAPLKELKKLNIGTSNTDADADNSLTVGLHALNRGHQSAAIGYDAYVGYNSSGKPVSTRPTGAIALGWSRANADYSLSAGHDTEVNHQWSAALNNNTKTGANSQTVIGSYNAAKTTTAFEVGNGTIDHRSNAFEVLQDGRAKVQSAPIDNDDVVRKLELDDLSREKLDFPKTFDYNEESVITINDVGFVDTKKVSDFLQKTGGNVTGDIHSTGEFTARRFTADEWLAAEGSYADKSALIATALVSSVQGSPDYSYFTIVVDDTSKLFVNKVVALCNDKGLIYGGLSAIRIASIDTNTKTVRFNVPEIDGDTFWGTKIGLYSSTIDETLYRYDRISNDNSYLEFPNSRGTIALTPNAAPSEPSFIITAADRTPTWQSAAPILQDYVDDALLGG